MSKPVEVSNFLTDLKPFFKDVHHIPSISFKTELSNLDLKEVLKLKSPRLLILAKLYFMFATILFPFVLEGIYDNLHNQSKLLFYVILASVLGFGQIFVDTYITWKLKCLQLDLRKRVAQAVMEAELINPLKTDNSQAWNLISNQADAMSNYYNSFLSVTTEIIKMVLTFCYLYYKMRSGTVVAFLLAVVLAATNFKVAKEIGRLYDEDVTIKADKFRLISFFVNRIQQLKMCRLENYFYERFMGIRAKQFANLTKKKMLDCVCVFFWQLTSILISSVSFIIYFKYYKHDKTAEFNVTTVIMMFQMLIFPLNMLPWGVSGMRNSLASKGRILQALNAVPKIRTGVEREPDSKVAKVQIYKAGTVIGNEGFKLQIPELTLEAGNIYTLVAQEGQGKTLFLKSLLGLVHSDYQARLLGKVGFVDSSLFHLRNSLSSIYNYPDISVLQHNKLTPELKQLLISLHCLEIPLKHGTMGYSGGQKLRLALLRALLDKDVVIVDASFDCLDKKVRAYVEKQLLNIVRTQGKIVVVVGNRALGKEVLEIKDGKLSVNKSQCDISSELAAHQRYKQQYVQQNLSPEASVQSLFTTTLLPPPMEQGKVTFACYRLYFKSGWHLILLVSLILGYSLKNYYTYFTTKQLNTSQTFVSDLVILVVCYILAMLVRSVSFALANLSQAKRIVKATIEAVCFCNIDFHMDFGGERMIGRYSGDCNDVDNNLPFNLNILWNDIFQFTFMLGIIIYQVPYATLPVILGSGYFYLTQKYYREKCTAIQILQKDSNSRLLEVVEYIIHGKHTILAMDTKETYLAALRNRLDQCYNYRVATQLLDRWLNLRFQFMTYTLLVIVLFSIYAYADDYDLTGLGIKLALTYAISITDKLGYLSRSLVHTQRSAISLKRLLQYLNPENVLDMERMTKSHKQAITKVQKAGQLGLSNVWFKYKGDERFILQDLSLYVGAGQKLLIRGKTGSGKTTLFKILTGLYKLNGTQLPFISFSPQKPLLLLDADLKENIDPYKLFPESQLEQILSKFSTQDIDNLSYSEQLKVNMVRAQLYGRNGLVIYDQPTQAIAEDGGTCLIVSHHGTYEVDREMELVDGKLADKNLRAGPIHIGMDNYLPEQLNQIDGC